MTKTFVFLNGNAIVLFPIPIVNDNVAESVEQFTISLSTTDPFAVLGPDSSVWINDNDSKFGTIYVYVI